ncbi:MAG: T9SS type A sorting domain-containing protein [Bacteroidetes bacterium]|nr:T9SS type A sorting domain-containing protein [Bacteroidota bacterium]MCW5895665.1 T9SS type A sorting domain-containing protein [Bacteroidota bacterium]
MKNVFAIAAMCCLISVLQNNTAAQYADGFWQDVAESAISPSGERLIIPVAYRTVTLNLPGLTGLLSQVPWEENVRAYHSQVLLSLPLPDGSFGRFRIVESPIMAPELAVRYPEIRTYLGQGIDDPTATVRFDVTPRGFHAMILSAGPTVYIDPYSRGTTQHYISYYKHAVLYEEARRFEEIGVEDPDGHMAAEIASLVAANRFTSIGEQLRTYRLALACTGEYATFHGGTKPLVLAEMVTAMNRVSGIYEREVAVRMVLIPNNDTLIYLNAATDPYTNNSGSTMLGQNQTTLDNIIGNANYDIGHVFSTGGGGIAGLGVVCRTGNKARGVTGLPSPIGDPFYVDYVAHEMGHQFGANHTFNGSSGSCSGGNRNASTAYEPGSGSTVMAYAGICSPQNIQNASDDYFHAVSIDEIVAYTTTGSGGGCPAVTSTGNNAPTVDVPGLGITIPLGTPFFMPGSASDFENDPLTYTWEEFDLGPAGHPNTPSGNAAIFRSFKGTIADSLRYFPRMSDIRNNTQTMGEILPSYARTLTFRLTARDNRAGGGGVGFGSTAITVSSAGPFIVTSPNTSVTWLRNSVDTVRWNVANTNIPPVSCTNVNILLSTDGGLTYPTVLAANTPNDGVQAVTIPNVLTTTARIKIEAVGNIFFDISNVNFAIGPVASPALVSPANTATGIPTSTALHWRTANGASTYHVQFSNDPGFGTLIVNDSTLTDTSRALSGLNNNTLYYWRVRAKNAEGVSGWSESWNFRTIIAPPAAPALVSPPNNAVNQPVSLTLQWSSVIFATSYQLEVATDSAFTVIVVSDSVAGTSRGVTLMNEVKYYWRVRARNAGGLGNPSPIWNFTTEAALSVAGRQGIPSDFQLMQNFPNPFNPSTVIEFALPREVNVTMEVFSLIGERVALLVNEKKTAGYHFVAFDAKGLASGLYIYRLRAGDFIQTRKLVLLR